MPCPEPTGLLARVLALLREPVHNFDTACFIVLQAVNYVDRFLSQTPIPRTQIQLVGVACMWISAKYEEIYSPTSADFCFITDNTYSKEQLVQMEDTVLQTLNYELTVPTAKTFIRRFLQVGIDVASDCCCCFGRLATRFTA